MSNAGQGISLVLAATAESFVTENPETQFSRPMGITLIQPAFIRVPADVSDLQQAINLIAEGGVIEIANGTYYSPAGEGFKIVDIGKSFTIRAASGATVTLDGGGNNQIITYLNSALGKGGPVTFEGLIFANGQSALDGRAAGVTLHRAEGTFLNCVFRNNVGNQVNSGGGGVIVGINSAATFQNSLWQNNVSQAGAGISIGSDSQVSIVNSQFLNNRTNLPNHSPIAAGGAIFVGNGTLNVSNSYFEGNEAGYVGGAIYIIGNWTNPVSVPRSQLTVVDSTFKNNRAVSDPSVTLTVPTEGGAIHSEDQTTTTISNSYFLNNSAETGGAVNLFRAITNISTSIFMGNKATGTGTGDGFGGAINVLSNDNNTGIRSGELSLRNSLIYGGISSVGQSAGGVSISGDGTTLTDPASRARATIDNVVFYNLDVQRSASGGFAGGLLLSFADATVNNSMFIGNDASGANSTGGGIAVLNNSLVNLNTVTIADNTAGTFGAGMSGQSSQIQVSDSLLIENEISPGVNEGEINSFGAAIFTAPDTNLNLQVTGSVDNCLISNNIGLPIFDDDRVAGPINDVRYNQNQIYSSSFGTNIYRDPIADTYNVSGLNNLVVTRNGGIASTPKSQVDNIALGSKPSVGALMAVPSSFNQLSGAALQATPTYTYYLGYAWSGGSATLDGSPLVENSGVVTITDQGQVHTLVVDGQVYTAAIQINVLDQKTFLPLILKN